MLADELFVERIQLEVGEDVRSSFVPEPELPVAQHVRRQCWADLIERLFQSTTQYHLNGSIMLWDEFPKISRGKIAFTQLVALVFQPIAKRVSVILQHGRILQECANCPMALSVWKYSKRLGK